MGDAALNDLADKLEGAGDLSDAEADAVVAALRAAGVSDPFQAADLSHTHKMLEAAYEILPGWDIALKGSISRPNGHWSCTVRRSAVRDNDEVLGVGGGPTMPRALCAALLRVIAQRR